MSTRRRATRFAALGAATVVAVSGLSLFGPGAASALPSPAPTGLAPNSATDAHKDVQLTWTPVAGATSYQIQILDDDNVDLAQALDATSALARWTVPVQLPTGEYRWRVRAVVGTTVGAWSPLATLERGWEDAPPTNEAPSGTALPAMSWAPIPDASFYEVEVSPRSFLSPQYSNDDSFVCWTQHTTFHPYGVALGGTTFASPPGNQASCAFTAQTPQAAAEEAAATAAAEAAAAAAARAAAAAAAATGATPTATATATQPPLAEPAKATKYQFGKTYYWRVRGRDGTVDPTTTPFSNSPGSCVGPWLKSGVTVEATDANGTRATIEQPVTPPVAAPTPECSLWSSEKTFVSVQPGAGLVNSAPTGLTVGPLTSASTSRVTASPTFGWTRVDGALYYRFYFSRDRLIGSVDLAAETWGTTFTPVSTLVLGSTSRYWAVQACGVGRLLLGDKQCGPVSPPQAISQVSTNPAAATSLVARPGYLLATWTTGLPDRSPAKAYDVRLTNTETGVATITRTDRVADSLTSGTSSLAIESATLAEGTYVMDVRPVDQSGRVTAWSATSGAALVVDRSLPTVKLTSAAGFVDRAAVTLTFNEPVSNVASSTLGVMSPTGAKVAGTLTPVSSSQYRFTPTAPWLTGGYDRAWASGVIDRAGQRVVASTASVRAGTTADSAGAALAFTSGDRTWATRTSSDAYRASYRSSYDDARTTAHQSSSVLVYGTSINVGLCKSPSSGSLRVYVDGRLRSTVSLYRSWTGCANAVKVTGLTRANHRVTLVGVSTGGRGYTGVDRVSVY